MLAIQNQISVLSKILAAKIQHQQIIDQQQALKKVSTPTPSRSRKTSANQETSSQNGTSKEKLISVGNNTNADRIEEISDMNKNARAEASGESSSIPESTGCTIS